jgi:3-deoxy-manno-octulosonate cytidylyltransferase (CMP-KDO synthetase)
MRTLIVIPARLASTRLPEKLLLRETGYCLLEHTYRAAQRSRRAAEVLVAVDDERLRSAVEAFGGTAVMTSPEAASGTDRLAEVAADRLDADLLVNVQGDEPEIAAVLIDQVIELLEQSPHASIATLATPLRDVERLLDPNCVKVVRGADGRALYFSRAAIPHAREGWGDTLMAAYWHHIGLYAYRRDFLLRFAALPPGDLERLERLEQLRALEHGHTIVVGHADHAAVGIDTRADYDAFVRRWRKSGRTLHS